MSLRLEDRARRRARARALAASIVDAPHVPRRFTAPAGGRLRPSDRHRRGRVEAPRLGDLAGAVSRRQIVAVALAVQVAALVALFVLPVFRVHTVRLAGTRLLSRATVLRAAGIEPSQSMFTLDVDGVRARLERLPWVRTAGVETDLPNTVRITVVEWTPVLRVERAGGVRLLSDNGSALTAEGVAAPPPSLPTLVDDRVPVPGGEGLQVDPVLVRTLAVIAAHYHDVFGCDVADFHWQSDGTLVVEASTGWRAVLGHEDEPDQVAAVPAQITALAALRGRLDFAKPNFGYIRLDDPSAPAVGGTPQPPLLAPPPGAAPAAAHGAPAAAPSAAPRAAQPSPTPSARPTPMNFGVIGR